MSPERGEMPADIEREAAENIEPEQVPEKSYRY